MRKLILLLIPLLAACDGTIVQKLTVDREYDNGRITEHYVVLDTGIVCKIKKDSFHIFAIGEAVTCATHITKQKAIPFNIETIQ